MRQYKRAAFVLKCVALDLSSDNMKNANEGEEVRPDCFIGKKEQMIVNKCSQRY